MSSEPLDQPSGLGDRLDDLLLRAETWVANSRTVVVAGVVVALAAAVVWWSVASTAADVPIEDSIPLAGSAPAASSTPAEPAPAAGPVPAGVDGSPPAGEQSSADEEEPEEAVVVVHVVGAVRIPGLVTLAPGDRISDAVAAAGGARPDADLARLNLASPVIDGMQIRVPVADEGATIEQPLVQLPTVGPGSADGEGPTRPGPVDLNRATESELQTLPGIGPALAARIVAWRGENGGFATVDDLEAVPGIGPAKLADLRDLVVV